MNGTRVTHLAAGTYEIQVHDNSTFHNFHLTGPGLDKSTEVDTKSVVTWTVTLTDGVYKYVCDPHASFMNGTFTVGTAQPPPPPPPPKCKVPKVVGKKLPAARRMITRAHCRVGRVHRATSGSRAAASSSRPRAGASRESGARASTWSSAAASGSCHLG